MTSLLTRMTAAACFYAVLWVFLFLPSPSIAAQPSEVFDFEQKLEARINAMVKHLDSRAFAIVEAKPTSTRVPVPLTPWTIPEWNGQSRSPRISSLKITVLSRTGSLDSAFLKQVRSIAAPFAQKTFLVQQKLPEAQTSPLMQQSKDILQTVLTRAQRLSNYLPWSLGAIASTAVFLILGFFLFSMSQLRIGSLLRQSSERIADAIGASAGFQPAANRTRALDADSYLPERAPAPAASPGLLSASGNIPEKLLAELPDEGLRALIADCYWAKEDGYAALIFRSLPTQKKLELIESLPWGTAYLDFCSNQQPQDLSKIYESQYLDPLPVTHLDNACLTTYVRKHAVLAARLPSLRMDNLSLGALERLELMGKNAKGTAHSQDTQKSLDSVLNTVRAAVPSESRNLFRTQMLHLTQVEEAQLLEKADLPADLLRMVPSLVWCAKLPKETVKAFLNQYQADEIALAWLAPQNILNILENLLPEKKRAIVLAYVQSSQPSRSSIAFQELAGALLEEYLRLREQGTASEVDRAA